ncbi:hypothetical protein AGMMS50239_38450 [Bacteroidia bacterium]|nr:hypothetical protein AGMMS50239_38450 [Bacteroidia bacterium]GHV06656.1 hypothetical protein FACS189416_7360 [Bacteroidia bacterium]
MEVRFINLSKVINTTHVSSIQDDAHDNYVKNYLAVNAYVAAVNQSKLPVLVHPSAQWADYQDNLISAKTAALDWTNSVAARLCSLPHSIINGDKAVQRLLNDGIARCVDLIKDPTDDYAKNKLSEDIEHSMGEIDGVIGNITTVLELLKKYNSTLPEQADKLQAIVDLAMKDKQVDNDKITALESDIKDMKDEISSLTAAIIALSIADAVAITLSVIAVAAAGPIGMLVWIFTGAVVAVATTIIVLDGIKITALKASIADKQKSMDDYTADVAALKLLSNTFSDLAQQAKAIEDNLSYILTVWQALSNDLSLLRTEFESAEVEFFSDDWTSIKADFQEALSLWEVFIQQVNIYSLDNVKGNTAQLQIGMNAQDVKNAMQDGQDMDIITYLNKVG